MISMLIFHRYTHSYIVVYLFQICPVCERRCATTSNLKRHMASSHGGKAKYTCEKCGCHLTVKRTYDNHVKACVPHVCHYKVPDEKAPLDAEGNRPKKDCGKTLKTVQALSRHMASHALHTAREDPEYQPTQKAFVCPMEGCGKRFASSNSMKVDHVPFCEHNPEKRPRKYCTHPGCKFSKAAGYVGFRKPKDLNRHWFSHGYTYKPPADDDDE